jgi:hypothetical protein
MRDGQKQNESTKSPTFCDAQKPEWPKKFGGGLVASRQNSCALNVQYLSSAMRQRGLQTLSSSGPHSQAVYYLMSEKGGAIAACASAARK